MDIFGFPLENVFILCLQFLDFVQVIIPSVIIVFVMYTAGAFFKEEQPLSLSLSTYPNAKVMMTDHRKNPTDLFNGTWNYIQANGDEIIPAYNTNIDNGKYI